MASSLNAEVFEQLLQDKESLLPFAQEVKVLIWSAVDERAIIVPVCNRIYIQFPLVSRPIDAMLSKAREFGLALDSFTSGHNKKRAAGPEVHPPA